MLGALSLVATEWVEIQKKPTGEIQMKKGAATTASNSQEELKIEVLDPSPPESTPQIEVNPEPIKPKGIARETIQIQILKRKAYVRWLGKEQEITLDAEGRFNLQIEGR